MANLGSELEQSSSPKRWAWHIVPGMLAAVAALALPLTLYTHRPILASCLMVGVVAWTLWRLLGANAWGVALWGLAGVILSTGFWTPVSFHGLLFFPSSVGFTVGGFVLSLPAGMIFLVASARNRSRCVGNCAGCMIVLFSFVIYWTAGGTMQTYRFGPQTVQETRTLILTLHRLSTEIEGFHTQLGRLPNSEAELVALRGKPMPPYYENLRVAYRRDQRTGYCLECLANNFWGDHWDIFPWIFYFYGPDAAQRLQVVAF